MKILAIKGKNLASIEGEFEIDFTAEPLKSTGIFAITGSTGSGKSTLLDALCLALFDDTPRINHAQENNIKITDVRDNTINQKDSRTILRRGTSDGYAEVDFVSLGSEKFRSRWSVRRSRDKTDGTLQNSEFRLTNLTTNTEEQGRKTELLAKITELIGLTFEQFTRAVLLAQGDFATFLKATQKEKAELLEKLTGTEIYSRISISVFEKSKNAEQELNIIRERIKDIELLTDEEAEVLTIESQAIIQEIEILKKETEALTGKIKWMADEQALRNSVEQAGQLLTNAQKAVADAKPRYDYLVRVDSVQEIRDNFNELKNSKKQLTDNKDKLVEQEKRRNANDLLLKQALDRIAACEAELGKHDENFQTIEPKIRQARELDIQLAGAATNAAEAEKEYKQAEAKKINLREGVETAQTSISRAKETISRIDAWFDGNSQYKSIVPRIDLVTNLLDDAEMAKRQEISNSLTLTKTKALLESELEGLTGLTKESERLNSLLPTEIAVLREKLKEGVPCPVCGSVHHPASKVSGESLEEENLNIAKKEVAGKITALTGQIEKRKNENIRLESVIASYANQFNEAVNKLNHFLARFPGWEASFEKGALKNSLKTVADIWNKNEADRTKANEQITNLQTALQLGIEQQIEAEAVYTAKEVKYKTAKVVFENLQGKRAELLGGKGADEVERFMAQRGKSLTDTLANLKEEKNKITAVNEKQAGEIKQIHQEITRLSGHSDTLQRAVEGWVSSEKRNITTEQLTELLSKNNAWIIAEREALNRLHQNKTTALATFNERTQTLEKHFLLEHKTTAEETGETLQAALAGKQEAARQKTARGTEIDILFANHNKGKERIALFEKELDEKSVLSENWKKLNNMFGSADGTKFKVLAQGYTLDALLAYANKHLQELSKRYEIQRIPETLALQVVDLDMLGEVRTVHSLSGGESFLISLALALGLSSLSSNRMKVEFLFIDEGFGSLDIDTLRIAMDALERLQTQGRKIGVISHIAEMTERISTRIQVIKTVNGKSRIEISGI